MTKTSIDANRQEKEAIDVWISSACEGLCNSAVERIRDEMRVHYALAVEYELRRGATRETAEKIAVEKFGDPKIANKRFRRTHLTEDEVKACLDDSSDVNKTWDNRVYPIFSIIWIVGQLFGYYASANPGWRIYSYAFFGFAFMLFVFRPSVYRAIAPKVAKKSASISLLLNEATWHDFMRVFLGSFSAVCGMRDTPFERYSVLYSTAHGILALIGSYWLLQRIRLVRKVRRVHQTELPPLPGIR